MVILQPESHINTGERGVGEGMRMPVIKYVRRGVNGGIFKMLNTVF